ncbi:helicase HerA-like domain-containing protein [Escherichia coli]
MRCCKKAYRQAPSSKIIPPRKGKRWRWMTALFGGLKDILFGTTRHASKDGVVQTMAKSAARQVTNQIVRGMLGSLLGGRGNQPGAICLCLMRRWRVLSCLHHCNILDFHNFSGMNKALLTIIKGAFAPSLVHSVTIFSLTATR